MQVYRFFTFLAAVFLASGFLLWPSAGIAIGDEQQPSAIYNPTNSSREIVQLTQDAFAAYDTGNYEKALPLFRKLLQAMETELGDMDSKTMGMKLGDKDANVPFVLIAEARIIENQGDFANAMSLLERSLKIIEKEGGKNYVYMGLVLHNLATLYERIGNDEAALNLSLRSLAIAEKLDGAEQPVAVAKSLDNIGALYIKIGAHQKAEPLLERSLMIKEKSVGSEHPDVAVTLDLLTTLFYREGNYEKAQALDRRSLQIRMKALAPDNPVIANNLENMAILYQLVGDWKQAASLLQQSLTIRERALGNEHPDTTRSLEFLARCFANQGNLSKSVFIFDETISRQRHHILGQLLTTAGERSKQPIEPLFAELDALYSLSSAATNNFPKAVLVAAQQSSLSKAFLEEFATTQSALETDESTATHELRQQYADVQAQLARLPDAELDVTQRDTMRRDLQIKLSQLEAKLAERASLVAQTIRERNFTLADVARDIPTEAALVDFIQYQRYDFTPKPNEWKESRYAAYLTFPLARDSTNVVVERVDLGEAAPINEAVEYVNELMNKKAHDLNISRFLPGALERVSQLVYAPLVAYLTNVSHLIVCPDGQLSRLPFEMLPVGNKFLIEEKTISYVTSGREIVRIASPKSSVHSSKSLIMGNPDFNLDLGSSRREEALTNKPETELSLVTSSPTRSLSRDYRGLNFVPLPGSGVEATNVAGLLGTDATLRLGADAREAELKAAVSPRVLHLATHGFYFPDQEFKRTNGLNNLDFAARRSLAPPGQDWENPLVRCGIALAGANHALQITNALAEDGLLTGLEASLLNLQGTELVILSACDSGTGEVKIGEGVMSLRRAFRIAGAESVLASHWPVSDKATSRLMTEFMRRWHSGEPRAQAWREAQLFLLRSKDFSNPYFWAAFTLTGQWN